MSIVLDILRTYRAPREVIRRRIGGRVREDRALACVMGACALIFVAQWPRLSREAHLDETIPFDARMAGALFGWLLVAPLFFYLLALGSGWLLRLAGRRAGGYAARMALFWALLAASPLWLLVGLASGFLGPSPGTTLAGILALSIFLVFWITGLFEIAAKHEDTA